MGGNSSRPKTNPAIRKALQVVLFALLLLSVPSQLAILVEDPGTYPYPSDRPWSGLVQEAMHYHGTNSAFREGLTWYFQDGNGNKCPLFTEACQAALADKNKSL